MAVLSVQAIDKDGLIPTLANAASGGDSFPNSGKVFVWLQNNHATDARTVTFTTPVTPGGLALADLAVTIAAADDNTFVCDLDPALYNDANGRTNMTYSNSGADIKVGVFRLKEKDA